MLRFMYLHTMSVMHEINYFIMYFYILFSPSGIYAQVYLQLLHKLSLWRKFWTIFNPCQADIVKYYRSFTKGILLVKTVSCSLKNNFFFRMMIECDA